MNALIRASLNNHYAVTVFVLTVIVLGVLAAGAIPIDILPPNNSPAVQVLTFYGGMPAKSVENDITNRMERWTGQAAGTARQESRSIVGASIVRNFYRDDIDPNGALTQVNSLASAAIPNLPPGTLPPVILPFDPTGSTPVCIVALDSKTQPEAILYDTGRYEVRNMIMGVPGSVAPVVYGGKVRCVMAYMDRARMQARNLSPLDLMAAIDNYNIFLPTGDVKLGKLDYALDSNSMYEFIDRMGDIPVKSENGKTIFLRDVATLKDANFIQTNVVRVNGRRQVYIPVFRQQGSSTLSVVEGLKSSIPDMKAKLTQPDIDLKVVMDQSVYVRNSMQSLVQEGVLGAILCSLVIMLFLGDWRMTLIAALTIPVAVMAALVCLHFTGNTINIMTLAGLSLAIGPLVDGAIICLENTHRHLGMGTKARDAAFLGASEMALPGLVACCCTLLVLAPLAFIPGLGKFLFRPMALAVAFAMIAAFLLSWTLVPTICMLWLKPHRSHEEHSGPDYQHRDRHEQGWSPRGPIARAFFVWESFIDACIDAYVAALRSVLRFRLAAVLGAIALLVAVVLGLGSKLRREFFPEVDAGAFEMTVRAPSGTRVEETERRVAEVEKFVRETIGEEDLELIISEIGLVADWSAAYTPNAGPMDAVLKVQLKEHRHHSAQEYVHQLRTGLAKKAAYNDLEFAFDAGGMVRSAMNEGKSTPLNIRVTGKNQEKAFQIADAIRREVRRVDGVVDCRILQRLDYPQYFVEVDQAKASDLGLTQSEVMKNLVAALNSSIQFNKKNFWIDPVSHNQYYVGVSYPESDIKSLDTLLDVPITSAAQKRSIPLRNLATLSRMTVPSEVTHTNLQATIDLTMGVSGRDLGHVADDVTRVVAKFGEPTGRDVWVPYDPSVLDKKKPLGGSKIMLSGEYSRMQDTFRNLGIGLILASMLVYFLMVALFKSYLTPLVILSAVPIGLVGVVTILFLTKTALNVQSLLGVIFMVGIVVSNTVLLIDFAMKLLRDEQLTPTEGIIKAASVRVRPVVMTGLAAFFALLPMSLGLERGSEANVPLGRAVIGGLLAGMATTLFVVPCLFSLVVRNRKEPAENQATPHDLSEPKGGSDESDSQAESA